MFALSLGKNICHAYGKHIEIKTVTQHNIVYSQRKKLTIWCKFLDIENSVSYNSDTMCGHGGIGRRVRLRGVWDDRVSSSLTGRTKDKQKLVFFFVPVGLCCALHNAPMVQNSHDLYRDASLFEQTQSLRYYGHFVCKCTRLLILIFAN